MTCSDQTLPLPRIYLSEASAQRSPQLISGLEARRFELRVPLPKAADEGLQAQTLFRRGRLGNDTLQAVVPLSYS